MPADDNSVKPVLSRWWLGSRPNEDRHGTLFLEGGKHLHVAVAPAISTAEEMFSRQLKLETLLGEDENGTKYTLEGVTPFQQKVRLGRGGGSETWRALRGYEGFHDARPERRQVTRVDFQIQGLADWWGVQPVQRARGPNRTSTWSLPKPKAETLRIPNILAVKLIETTNEHLDDKGVHHSVDAHVKMSFPKPVSLRVAEHHAEVFRFLLCLSARRRLEFTWQRLHVVGESEPVHRLLRSPSKTSLGVIGCHQFGFRYQDLKHRKHAALAAWYEISRAKRPAMDWLIADIYGQTGIAGSQLLAMTNSLEGYHRRLPGGGRDIALLDRFNALVNRSGTALPENIDWSKTTVDLRDARNYHSHYFMPSNPKRKKLTIAYMQTLIFRARTLLQDQIFIEIGLKIDKRTELAKQSATNQSLTLPGIDAAISF